MYKRHARRDHEPTRSTSGTSSRGTTAPSAASSSAPAPAGSCCFYAEDPERVRQAIRASTGSPRSASASTTTAPSSCREADANASCSAGGVGDPHAVRLTAEIPKPLLPVAGVPFAVHQLQLACVLRGSTTSCTRSVTSAR